MGEARPSSFHKKMEGDLTQRKKDAGSSSSSSPSVVVEYPYPYPSHVFVPKFVTVKLSGRDDFNLWKTQMHCLLVSHGMLDFTEKTFVSLESCAVLGKEKVGDVEAWRRSDALVKGWILGSLSQQALRIVLDGRPKDSDFTAKYVWDKLQSMYGPLVNSIQQDLKRAITREAESTIQVSLVPEDADAKKKEKEAAKKREKLCLNLYQAILRGSWDDVDGILKTKIVTVTDKISINGNTALHVAVGTTKNLEFVERMLKEVPAPLETTLLELKNSDGSTLLHVAATVGNEEVAKVLVGQSPQLLYAEDRDGFMPLARALSNMHADTYVCLLKMTNSDIEQGNLFGGTSGDELLVNAISAKDFHSAMTLTRQCGKLNSDAALMAIVQNYPTDVSRWEMWLYNCQHDNYERIVSEAKTRNTMEQFIQLIVIKWSIQILLMIALKWKVWSSRSIQERVGILFGARKALRAVCDKIGDSSDSSSEHGYYNNPILEAARLNAYEVVEFIVYHFPNAIWSENEDGHNIIQYAVINRSEQVYNLLYQMSEHKNIYKTIKDRHENNLLHLAGRLAPTNKLKLISGAALQIQHELQWFKEVERFVCPLNKVQKNSFGETPQMIFTREHTNLVIEGEKWMKATAESYTITAALITTIVFAAAITVPGGSNQDKGIPIFTHDVAFTVFAVSDAISLFTSTTSLLMFLSILTARFAEEDFLFKLPTKVIIGLTTLFISTTAMIIAFGATLFLVFGQRRSWILGPIAALICLPIASFAFLQFPLIADLTAATFCRSIFGKKRDDPFY